MSKKNTNLKPDDIEKLESLLNDKQLEFLRGVYHEALRKMESEEFDGWDLEETPVGRWLWYSLLDMFVHASQKMKVYQDVIESLKEKLLKKEKSTVTIHDDAPFINSDKWNRYKWNQNEIYINMYKKEKMFSNLNKYKYYESQQNYFDKN